MHYTDDSDVEAEPQVKRNTHLDRQTVQRRTTVANTSGNVEEMDRRNTAAGTTEPHSESKSQLMPTATPPLAHRSKFGLKRPKFSCRRFLKAFTPKSIPSPGYKESLLAVVKASWLNLLLVCIPVSWALNFALHESTLKDTLVFIFSFLAIIPLAKLLAYGTDELSKRFGQAMAGLINATLGNVVELIVAIIALVKCELRIVQSSLLVLGMCFLAGGFKYSQQGFGVSATQLNSALLTVSVIAVLLPAAFRINAVTDDASKQAQILQVSHGVAIILLLIYVMYLGFQLFSHADLFDDDAPDAPKSTKYSKVKKSEKHAQVVAAFHPDSAATTTAAEDSPVASSVSFNDVEAQKKEEEDEEEKAEMNLAVTFGLVVGVAILVAFTAEWLVHSIDGITATGIINKEFIGLILLPIVGNAAEHATAVTVSVKDKLTLSIQVAVGSSISKQIALFVIPVIVILGWILGKPLTLLFDGYESISLLLAVITVNVVVQDGKSNWLEGAILMALYLILAVTYWYYPGSDLGYACH
ncbi:hypothetical protein AMATHDRAFT_1496 [Amanita thiersii Skay4041]|uniref:Sodium/calcium exchanger membrane region domain-containing protein n=1 Tax=Amanita thiersii Skay4041 TaxID=703135 RepID=A0A2A9NQ03_9AGAR|nr:hypothetical protein AMATHDRAFT_1496 [Amanita thiersii Skay4041]